MFRLFYNRTGDQKKWVISLTAIFPLIFSVWGTIISLRSYHLSVDVGTARKDSSVTGKYYFTNTGTKRLVIDFVNPDCSCTGFYLTKKEIEPGDSSCLVLKMSTKNKEGDIQINATISANTPTHFYKVSLIAKVI